MSLQKVLRALLASGLLLASRLPAETWRNHFDSDGASRAPAFFDFVVLGAEGKANWMVLADHNPPSSPNQVTQTVVSRPEGSIAVAVRRNVEFQDGRISVAIKKLPSHGGLVLRMKDDKDFLALLLDATSGEARLTSWRDGKPTALAQGKALIERDWGILEVKLSGRAVSATWNQKPLLDAKDPKPISGRYGLAAEGPGNSSFDEFVLETP
jgi:hypothetical protein